MCDSDIDYDVDQLVSCDSCGVTVHQSCYGVPELPGHDDVWLCRACELKEQVGHLGGGCRAVQQHYVLPWNTSRAVEGVGLRRGRCVCQRRVGHARTLCVAPLPTSSKPTRSGALPSHPAPHRASRSPSAACALWRGAL